MTLHTFYRCEKILCEAVAAERPKGCVCQIPLLTCLVVALAAYTFINVTPAGHPCIPAGIHRPSVVSGRRINSVEHSAI